MADMPSLLMVDDILNVSKCETTPSAMNSTVNTVIESKKLTLSHKKCCVVHVGKKAGVCPILKVHDNIMHREESTKYIGDIFHNNSKLKHNLLERTSKAHILLSEIHAILNNVPLGKFRTEKGLQLRKAMFGKGLLLKEEKKKST